MVTFALRHDPAGCSLTQLKRPPPPHLLLRATLSVFK